MHQLKEDIFWTGYIDWNLGVFHGYLTPYGSTYNSYLILDEKPTLIDTVKYYGFEEMLRRIQAQIDPKEIKYIVCNHAEGDHSTSIGKLLELCPDAEIVCSPKCVDILKSQPILKNDKNQSNWKFKTVESGDQLNIGKRTLTFVHMPMVHWPESMATFSGDDKVLFPNDAFGQHYASSERFADQVSLEIIYQEAQKYYGNIVLPYGNQVLKVLDAIKDLDIEMIAPSHGMIWRRPEDIAKIKELYKKWASHETDDRAVIVYDTMYESTEKQAIHIFEMLDNAGIPVKLMNLENAHISDIVTDVIVSKFIFFGTPILNNRMLPTMGNLMTYLKGLKPKGRTAFAFGSYGWSKIGFKELEANIQEAGMELAADGKYFQFVPSAEDLNQFEEWLPLVKESIAV